MSKIKFEQKYNFACHLAPVCLMSIINLDQLFLSNKTNSTDKSLLCVDVVQVCTLTYILLRKWLPPTLQLGVKCTDFLSPSFISSYYNSPQWIKPSVYLNVDSKNHVITLANDKRLGLVFMRDKGLKKKIVSRNRGTPRAAICNIHEMFSVASVQRLNIKQMKILFSTSESKFIARTVGLLA